MVKPTLPVDIYVRVSRVGKRGEKLISPDEQERRARDLARTRGLKVGQVLTDLDESGGKLDRPGLSEALRRVEAHESGGLIVAWLDRLSRDSEQALGLLRRMEEAGAVVYAPDAPADWTTPEGELQAGFVFLLATYVRRRARAGFERAKEQAIARGIPVHTRPPVGYRKRRLPDPVAGDVGDPRLEPDPAAAPVVREVFERRAQGEGPAELGAFLTASGVTTSQRSATWSKQAIYNLLSNRVYLGELHYGTDDRFVNPAAHDPIVDLATWTAAQHPNGRRLAPARSQGSDYLLTGILRCAECRYCLQGTTTSRGKRIYRCTRTHAGGLCPAPARVAADKVEAAAVEAFWTLTADLEAQGSEDTHDDLTGLEQALERAETALRQYMAPAVQDAIGDPALWATGLRERREARDQAADELGKARAAVKSSAVPLSTATLRATWERMTAPQRRELLGIRFDCIGLRRDPAGIVVYSAGAGPADLPRRGFKSAPVLAALPDPPSGARVLAL